MVVRLPELTSPAAGAVLRNHEETVGILYPCALRAERWRLWWKQQATAERNQ